MSIKIVLKGLGIEYIFNVIQTIATFVSIPMYIGLLGDDRYGVWLAISGYIGFWALLDLPFDNKVLLLASADENFKSPRFYGLLQSVFFLKIINILILCSFSVFALPLVVSTMNYSGVERDDVIFSFCLSIFNLIIGMGCNTAAIILFARMDSVYLVTVQCVSTLIATFIPVLLLMSGFGLLAFAFGQIISTVFLIVMNVRRLSKKHLHLSYLLVSKFDCSEIKNLAAFALAFQYNKLGNVARQNLPHVVVNYLFGPQFNTLLMALTKLPLIIISYLQKGVLYFLPYLIKIENEGSGLLVVMYQRLFWISFAISFLLFLTLYYLVDPIMSIWISIDLSGLNDLVGIICVYGFLLTLTSIMQQKLLISSNFRGQNFFLTIELILMSIVLYLFHGELNFNELFIIVYVSPLISVVYAFYGAQLSYRFLDMIMLIKAVLFSFAQLTAFLVLQNWIEINVKAPIFYILTLIAMCGALLLLTFLASKTLIQRRYI